MIAAYVRVVRGVTSDSPLGRFRTTRTAFCEEPCYAPSAVAADFGAQFGGVLAPSGGVVDARERSELSRAGRHRSHPFARELGSVAHYTVGLMFWLWRNRFVGSYLFFSATSRS